MWVVMKPTILARAAAKTECDRIGVHRVYLNFIRQVNDVVKSHGRQMMFWGDVILHQPELIAELPKDVIALQWGYEATHPFDKECEKFQQAGVPFMSVPAHRVGTRSQGERITRSEI